MWKKLYDLSRLIFFFGEKTQKNQDNIEALQQEVQQLTEVVRQMNFELTRLRDEFNQSKENERLERELLMLRLENEFLKFERRLPPGKKEGE